MAKKQFNHTIPRFILEGFCIPNFNKIGVYKIKNGIVKDGFNINSGNREKYFGKRGFYSNKTLDNYIKNTEIIFTDKNLTIEDNLAKFENEIALIVKKIKSNSTTIINNEELDKIKKYAFIQFLRTKKFKTMSSLIYQQFTVPDMREELKNNILKNDSSIFNQLGINNETLSQILNNNEYLNIGQNIIETEFNKHISHNQRHEIDLSNLEYLKHFEDIVNVNKIKILKNITNEMIVLPDTGIICLVQKTYNNEKIELLIPISNEIYILLYNEKTNYDCELSAKKIDEINQYAYLDSEIAIFGNNIEKLNHFGSYYDLKEIEDNGLGKKFI